MADRRKSETQPNFGHFVEVSMVLEEETDDCSTPWRPMWGRMGASVLIIGMLWAIVGRPIEFATRGPSGPSPASSAFYMPIRGFSEFAYLNHGYAFFAPDPGPSHLFRVRVVSSDPDAIGTDEGERTYPDLERQWPRLLYHRHFMLAEFLHNTYQPKGVPESIAGDASMVALWQLERARHEAILASFESHLLKTTGAEQIELRRFEHRLVGLPEFLAGQRQLNDPSLYFELMDSEADVPAIPRFGVPPEGRPIFGRGQ